MPDLEPPWAPQQQRPPSRSRITAHGKTMLAAVGLSVVVLAVSVAACGIGHAGGPSIDGSSLWTATTSNTDAATASDGGNSSLPGSPPESTDTADVQARAALAALIAQAPAGGVSVAVRDVTSGREFSAGANTGMTSASVAKIEILETMLLQRAGPLRGALDDTATDMIEHSSNNAADDCFAALGGASAYVAALPRLGLDPRLTVADQGFYWGLNRTSAAQQVILLRNLVDADSPLSAAARAYALALMRDVEDDQRWGVPVIADPGTVAANKNGWLNIDSDDGLWAVNSEGIVTVHGHTLLMSVMTQHNASFDAGTDRVARLVPALAAVVKP